MAKNKQTDTSTEAGTETGIETTASGIEIGNPIDLRPKELPLVVKLPEGASLAQQEFSKVLNAYAYKNPTKWAVKKNGLIAKLEALKDAPDPVVDENAPKITYSKKPLG